MKYGNIFVFGERERTVEEVVVVYFSVNSQCTPAETEEN
jgi:hypothetical protein